MILIQLLMVFCFASDSLNQNVKGIWLNIGWFEEGSYNNETYSDTVFPDTIEYLMTIDSNICKAYTFYEDRIFSSANFYTITTDSIYSQSLELPLSWKRNNDTLFSSMIFVDGNSWEKITHIFLLTPTLEFPDKWPLTNSIYVPDELTPFGLWGFGISPENPLRIIRTKKIKQNVIKNAVQISQVYFLLNGRQCQSLNRKRTSSILVNYKLKQLKGLSN